ncbi:hypothetical protein [Sphingomonas sp.]
MTDALPPENKPLERRSSDRRVARDPAYAGPERRKGDRRETR